LFDLKNLHKYYDVSGDGAISYNEFINALSCGKLSKRALAIVESAWAVVDKKRSGECSGQDIQDCYKLEAAQFLAFFDCGADGKISKDQFEQHYREIATATPNDDYFVMAIEKEWGIKEEEDASVKMTEVMHIVKLLRQRLISLSNQN
jgi:Ca2+-binding EF-hand superfamily protein